MKAITRETKFLLIAVAVGAVYTIVAGNCAHERGIAEFKTFNEADISGIIQNCSLAQMGARFMVKDQMYYVTNLTDVNNKQGNFLETVKPGDSIVKKRYSDSIIILHGSKKHIYTFGRILP